MEAEKRKQQGFKTAIDRVMVIGHLQHER